MGFVGHASGPDDIWAEPGGGGYPILSWQLSPLPGLPRFSRGNEEPNEPYLVSESEGLNNVGHNPRLMGCHFKAVADLDLTGIRLYSIGDCGSSYIGSFHSNGHVISHVTINGERHLGVLCALSGEVKEPGVVDVNMAGSSPRVGGLVGENYGGCCDPML